MIIAIYKDDGPLYGGDQDMERTAPHEKAVPFTDDAAFRLADNKLSRLADNKLSEETAQRRNPRYIKWYEVEGVIPIAVVRDALAELRENLQPGLFWTEGTHARAMADFDATMTALGLGAEG